MKKTSKYVIFYRRLSKHFKSPWVRIQAVKAENRVEALKEHTKRSDFTSKFNEQGKVIYYFKKDLSTEYCVVFEKTLKENPLND